MIARQPSFSLLIRQIILCIALSCVFFTGADQGPISGEGSSIAQNNNATQTTTTILLEQTRSEPYINYDEIRRQDQILLPPHPKSRQLEDGSWCFFTSLSWNTLSDEYRNALIALNETQNTWDNCLINELWGFRWDDLDPEHKEAARTLGFNEQRWYNTGYYSCDWDCETNNPVEPGSNAPCLSAYSQVEVLGRGLTSLKDLRENDKILVLDKYENVYGFGHNDVYAVASFLRLTTSSNPENPLEITGEHLVMRQKNSTTGDGVPVRADDIQVGNFLVNSQGEGELVISVSSVSRPGLYSPLTKDGTFLANGVLVSSYTAATENHPENFMMGNNYKVASHHFMSHIAISPFRAMCLAGFATICEQRNSGGQLLFAATAEKLNTCMSVILLLGILPFYFVEQYFGILFIVTMFPLVWVLVTRYIIFNFCILKKHKC